MTKGVAPGAILGVSFFLSAAWTALLFVPSGWQVKSTMIWDFDCGLYHVKVSKAIGGHVLGGLASLSKSDKAKAVVDAFTEGDGTIQGYRDQFCNLGMIIPSNCTPWQHLLIGSWIMLFTAVITAILLFSGSGLYYYYYSNESLSRIRQWAMGCFALAPVIAIGGLGGYACLTFAFAQWLQEFMIANSSNITFGLTSIFAAFVGLLTAIPAILVALCGKRAEAEYFAEAQEDQNLTGYQQMQDPYAQGGYGAAAPGYDQGYSQGGQGQYQQYPQQGY